MIPIFSLVRFPNLLIIAFTQYIMRYAIVQPLVRLHGFELQMTGLTFFCLVLSTMCTAAAGYAINDYFDVKTDQINRPDKVVVGKSISRRKAMIIHIILCALGILLGGYVTWRIGVPQLALLYLLIAGMLWLYSTTYKRQFLIGNIIVSLFTALVPMMVLLDIPPLNIAYRQQMLETHTNLTSIILWISGFAGFAFLTTLSREIIKDAEDFEGDITYGCRSVPIVLGSCCTKSIIIGVNVVIVGMLILAFWYLPRLTACGQFDYVTRSYLLFLLIIPTIWISLKVYKATTSDDYRKAGNWTKWLMLSGICYAVVFWLCN